MTQQDTLLSVCIPAYNRPIWFARALRSIVTDLSDSYKKQIEVIISDDSDNNECSAIADEILQPLNINYKYIYNQQRLGMAANWNHSIKLASGKYVLLLHDDDFLLPNGIANILATIHKEKHSVMLFGVNVVNEQEKVIKKQSYRRKVYLNQKKALIKVLSHSSFIRFPGIVFKKETFQEAGYFDTQIGEIADLEMWIRLLSKYGLLCLPTSVSCYSVHTEALTTGMFNEEIIKKIINLFDRVKKDAVLCDRQLERCKSDFIHQFILAGTYREIKQGNIQAALNIFKRFCDHKYKISFKWIIVRLVIRGYLYFLDYFSLIYWHQSKYF